MRNIALAVFCGVLLLCSPTQAGTAPAPYCGPNAFASPAARPFGSATRRISCKTYHLHAPLEELVLAIAADQKDRERGLMFVKPLPSHVGMIFVYPDGDGARAFWMKNTLIPLDMVFIASDGVVSSIADNVPSTTPSTADRDIPRRVGVGKYVLELNAGEAAHDGIFLGTRFTLAPIPNVR